MKSSKTKTLFFLSCFCILLAGISPAENTKEEKKDVETISISGKVIDKVSGEEIAGAEIVIENATFYTDLEGNFTATVKAAKEQEIEVKFVSYRETKINIDPSVLNNVLVELEAK